jgi:hypothetical protein
VACKKGETYLAALLTLSVFPGLIFGHIQAAFPPRPHMQFLYQIGYLRVRYIVALFHSHTLKILNFISGAEVLLYWRCSFREESHIFVYKSISSVPSSQKRIILFT